MTCPHCGSAIDLSAYEIRLRVCPECGQELPTEAPPPLEPNRHSGPLSPPRTRNYSFVFTGTAGEYFRIWIVNVFLTVVTLGIYSAWAKVRTRQYFYAHTRLAGHGFDYLAKPLSILKGHLIVAAGFLVYYLAQYFAPNLSYVVLGLFYLLFPLLVYLSLKFKAHYSAYRNIRFHFHGTLKESYTNYLFVPLLLPLTLGLMFPYVMFRQTRYFFDNFAFGRTRNSFTGRLGRFYTVYAQAFAMSLGVMALYAVVVFVPTFSRTYASGTYLGGGDAFNIIFGMIAGYLILILSFALIQQFIYAGITNHAWTHSSLGTVRFDSTLRARQLVGIHVGNLLAIVFSLGLLIPWAKVRHARYLLDNLDVITEGDLDHFTADVGSEPTALGDAAADFFDFDIGL